MVTEKEEKDIRATILQAKKNYNWYVINKIKLTPHFQVIH